MSYITPQAFTIGISEQVNLNALQDITLNSTLMDIGEFFQKRFYNSRDQKFFLDIDTMFNPTQIDAKVTIAWNWPFFTNKAKLQLKSYFQPGRKGDIYRFGIYYIDKFAAPTSDVRLYPDMTDNGASKSLIGWVSDFANTQLASSSLFGFYVATGSNGAVFTDLDESWLYGIRSAESYLPFLLDIVPAWPGWNVPGDPQFWRKEASIGNIFGALDVKLKFHSIGALQIDLSKLGVIALNDNVALTAITSNQNIVVQNSYSGGGGMGWNIDGKGTYNESQFMTVADFHLDFPLPFWTPDKFGDAGDAFIGSLVGVLLGGFSGFSFKDLQLARDGAEIEFVKAVLGGISGGIGGGKPIGETLCPLFATSHLQLGSIPYKAFRNTTDDPFPDGQIDDAGTFHSIVDLIKQFIGC
jgi:hypothetical protein